MESQRRNTISRTIKREMHQYFTWKDYPQLYTSFKKLKEKMGIELQDLHHLVGPALRSHLIPNTVHVFQ